MVAQKDATTEPEKDGDTKDERYILISIDYHFHSLFTLLTRLVSWLVTWLAGSPHMLLAGCPSHVKVGCTASPPSPAAFPPKMGFF